MFFVNNAQHSGNDRRCAECYRGFPTKCVCGGLIHAQFIKEGWEGGVQVAHNCDVCGDKYKFPTHTNHKKIFVSKRKGRKRR
jgi:hypothetical protein